MRIFFGFLLLLMLLFMAVQYNDPDGLFWMAVYGVPALWCGLAAFGTHSIDSQPALKVLWFSIVLSIVGVIYYWPLTPYFWRKAVWYEVETAREGMGMMIVFSVLVLVLIYAHYRRRSAVTQTAASAV